MGLIPWPEGETELQVPGTSFFLLDAGKVENGQRRRELGHGGQGIVYAARNGTDPLDRLAIKFPLYPSWAAPPAALAWVREEARLGTRIGTSPHLARTYELIDLQGQKGWPPLGFVMEFLPVNLDELVRLCDRHEYRFSAQQVVEWAGQLCEGLCELHERHQLVHRDLTVRNIMFRLSGNALAENPRSLAGAEAVITDFGTVARLGTYAGRTVFRKGNDPCKHPDFYPLHQEGQRAPRQFCDPEMDVHALGEVLRVLHRLRQGRRSMTKQSPLDLLEDLAERCCGGRGQRPKPRSILNELRLIDWEAHAELLQGQVASLPEPTALVESAEQADRLRAAGWQIEEHPRFVGRDFVRERFEAFAKSCHDRQRGGVFVVQAPAGCGKTALLTHWMANKAIRAGFFFRYRDGRISAAAMPEALWNQLGATFGLAPGPVPSEAEFTARLEERLRKVAQEKLRAGEPLLLFIDALDEADDPGRAASLIPKLLPRNVLVVASSRPPQQGQDHLAGLKAAGAEVFRLDPDSPENRRDLAAFFREQLAGLCEPGQEEQLAEAVGGSFMLGTLLAEAIRREGLTVGDVVRQSRTWADLPTDQRLFAYYRECWDRACKLVDEDALAQFALLLAAAENWISERQVFAILRWNEARQGPRWESLWSAATFKRVTAALSWVIERGEWRQGGYASEFLQVRHQSAREFVVALRHQSLRDFFAGVASPTLLTPADMHAVTAEYYVEQAARDGWGQVDPYGRFYVIRHLNQSGRREHATIAARLLVDVPYLEATLGDESPADEARREGGNR